MGLFTGSDVESHSRWWQRPWLLAVATAGFPADLTVGLLAGMPKLRDALVATELPVPAATQVLMDLGAFLEHWWALVLAPLVLAPLLAAWRLGHRAVPVLSVWLALQVALFIATCLALAWPIKTILDAVDTTTGGGAVP